MAAIAFHRADPLNYISEWFKKETYLKAYQFNISLVKGISFWPTSVEGPMLPSMTKRMPGRPPKKRKKEPLEGKNKTKLSKEGRMLRCGICHMEGHNRKTCLKKLLEYVYYTCCSSITFLFPSEFNLFITRVFIMAL